MCYGTPIVFLLAGRLWFCQTQVSREKHTVRDITDNHDHPIEYYYVADVSSEVCEYTRNQVERFARASFKEAQKRKAPLWNIHKANILATSRFWNAVFAEVKNDFPDVVMKEESIMYQISRSFCTFSAITEYIWAMLSPTVKLPNSV